MEADISESNILKLALANQKVQMNEDQLSVTSDMTSYHGYKAVGLNKVYIFFYQWGLICKASTCYLSGGLVPCYFIQHNLLVFCLLC